MLRSYLIQSFLSPLARILRLSNGFFLSDKDVYQIIRSDFKSINIGSECFWTTPMKWQKYCFPCKLWSRIVPLKFILGDFWFSKNYEKCLFYVTSKRLHKFSKKTTQKSVVHSPFSRFWNEFSFPHVTLQSSLKFSFSEGRSSKFAVTF